MSEGRVDVVLAVSGSIAAFKAVEVTRWLLKRGARVQVVMTRSAERFIGRSTFSGLTGRPALLEMFDVPGESHVELSRLASVFAVVPATADTLARLAQGRADDLLTATALCFQGQRFVAPAMHPRMWAHRATLRNVTTLKQDGIHFLGPVHGEVASGEVGLGRLLAPEQIAAQLWPGLQSLAGKRIIISAGPTVESIDPARFLSNASSGKMGFSLAAEAARRGASVELVAGPVGLETPPGVLRSNVETTEEMLAALAEALDTPADAVLMVAAVADYRPARPSAQKLKRDGPLTLELLENPDIIATLVRERRNACPLFVAFALETGSDQEVLRKAKDKLVNKGVDAIVANVASEALRGDTNRVTLVRRSSQKAWPTLPKTEVAQRLLEELFPQREEPSE